MSPLRYLDNGSRLQHLIEITDGWIFLRDFEFVIFTNLEQMLFQYDASHSASGPYVLVLQEFSRCNDLAIEDICLNKLPYFEQRAFKSTLSCQEDRHLLLEVRNRRFDVYDDFVSIPRHLRTFQCVLYAI